MPTYTVTDPTSGKTIDITGNAPPTEAELTQIFAAANNKPGIDIGHKIADAAPLVGGILGGLGGAVVGGAGGVLAGGFGAIPGGIVGSAVGTTAGTGTGGLIKSRLNDLMGTPLTKDQEFSSAITQPAIAGATDAILGVAGQVAGKVLEPVGTLLTKTIPEGLMGNVFKEPLKETRAAIRASMMKDGEVANLGTEALKRGEMGSAEQIFTKSAQEIQTLEDSLQTALDGTKKTISLDKIKEELLPYVVKLKQAGNKADADALIQRIAHIEEAAGSSEIPVATANEIKRTLYDEARNAYGKTASESIEGIKKIARGFKEQIQKAVPEVVDINKELSYHGRVVDAMTDRIARVGRNELLSLKNAGYLATGAAAAPFTGGVSLIPAATAIVGGTTQGMTGTAQALSKIPAVTEAIAPLIKYGKNVVAPLIGDQLAPKGAGGGKLGLNIPPKYAYK